MIPPLLTETRVLNCFTYSPGSRYPSPRLDPSYPRAVAQKRLPPEFGPVAGLVSRSKAGSARLKGSRPGDWQSKTVDLSTEVGDAELMT